MQALAKGRYRARLAETAADLDAAQRLRHQTFRARRGLGPSEGRDSDAHDAACLHMLIEEVPSGQLVCCYRLLRLEGGWGIGRSYAAQHYDLRALAAYPGPMVELGRFCLHPDHSDPDILRLAWAALTRVVDETGAKMLFGCSSFAGADAAPHTEALALLKDAHLGPRRWLPRVKAAQVFRFARALKAMKPDVKRAMQTMPPLLRTYLLMGGWVSDHAVLDRDLDTLHVFTGVEISAIPPARARALRLLSC